MRLKPENAIKGDKIHKMAVKELIDTMEDENKNKNNKEINDYIIKLSTEF